MLANNKTGTVEKVSRTDNITHKNDANFHFSFSFIRRLSSTGDESESNDECPSIHRSNVPATAVPADYNLEEHYSFLAAREHLEEFSGQVPPKKKKKLVEEKTESDSPSAIKPKRKVSL